MNSVNVIGNLVREPYYREYGSGDKTVKVAKYTVAVSRSTKNGGADFISCTAFGNNAVYASKYMEKGDLISIEGSIHSSNYTDKDGNRKYDSCVYVAHNQNYSSRKDKELLENAEENERRINDAIESLDGSVIDSEYPEFDDLFIEDDPFE